MWSLWKMICQDSILKFVEKDVRIAFCGNIRTKWDSNLEWIKNPSLI